MAEDRRKGDFAVFRAQIQSCTWKMSFSFSILSPFFGAHSALLCTFFAVVGAKGGYNYK